MRDGGTPDVQVTNTFPWTLYLLERCYGGKVRYRGNKKRGRALWEWSVSGTAALDCCSSVLPYLVEKRRQAALLLTIRATPPHSATRAALIQELKDLKRVSYQ